MLFLEKSLPCGDSFISSPYEKEQLPFENQDDLYFDFASTTLSIVHPCVCFCDHARSSFTGGSLNCSSRDGILFCDPDRYFV